MSTLVADLRKQGFSYVDHGVPQDLIDHAATLFREVLKEVPEPALERTFLQPPIENYSPLGYVRKYGEWKVNPETGGKEWNDPKRLIQSDQHLWPEHPEVRSLMQKSNVFREFVEANARLLAAFELVGIEIIDHINRDYPGYRDYLLAGGKIPGLVLRHIAYDAHDDDAVSAVRHRDKGGFTLTVYESAPGLVVCETNSSAEHRVATAPGESLVMVAHHTEALSQGELLAAPHFVLQPPGHRVTDDIGRQSLVMFFDCLLGALPNPSYAETHR